MNAMQNRSATEDATGDFKPNGNGHQKAFSIGPSKDAEERTLKILGIRARIHSHPALINSEQNFGIWLLDRALHPQLKERDGVVVVSRTVCARQRKVSKDTIDRWNKHLEASGEIWLDKLKRPNMWPANRYHFTTLDPKRHDTQYTRDGVYGGSGSRQGPKAARKFTPGQKMLPLPGSKQIRKSEGGYLETESGLWVPQFSQVVDATTETPDTRRLTVVNHDDSQSLPVTTDSRYPRRLTVVNHDDSQSLPVTTDSRHETGPAVVANPAHIRGSDKSIEPCTKKGEGTPPGDDFDEWRLSLKSYLRSGLQKLRGEVYVQSRVARTDADKADWQRRLDAIDEQIYGRKVHSATPPKPKPKTVSQIQPMPTAEELAEGAAYALSIGKKNLVTAEQLAALQKTGNHQRKAETV